MRTGLDVGGTNGSISLYSALVRVMLNLGILMILMIMGYVGTDVNTKRGAQCAIVG